MAMDHLSEEDEKLSIQLQSYRFLVADASPSNKSLRMLLSKLLIKPSQVDLAESFVEAEEKIRTRIPDFVFAEQGLLAEGGMDGASSLVQLHHEKVAPGRAHALMLVTAKGSDSATAGAAIDNIDAVLIKPFTFESLKDEVLRVIREKLYPPPFTRELSEGKAALEKGELKVALEAFRRARDLAAGPHERAVAWSQEGRSFQKLKRHPEAIRSLQEALVHEPGHYRSMIALLEIHIQTGDHVQAYAMAKEIAANHPVPTKLLPEFIRLSVLNKNLEDLLGFYKYAEQAQADSLTMQHLSAGLAVCGLQYLKDGQVASAVDAFRKAEVASKSSPRIIKRILFALISAGLDVEVKSFFARAPSEVRESPDLKIAELEFVERSSNAHHALDFAVRLLSEGTRTERVYEIAIRRSAEIGRKAVHVEELVAKATRDHPAKQEWFKELAATPPAPGAVSERGKTG